VTQAEPATATYEEHREGHA